VASWGVTGGVPSNDPAGGLRLATAGSPDPGGLSDLMNAARPTVTGYGFWGAGVGLMSPPTGGSGGAPGSSWLSPQDGSLHLDQPIDVHDCVADG
jgi:hypothetical protein